MRVRFPAHRMLKLILLLCCITQSFGDGGYFTQLISVSVSGGQRAVLEIDGDIVHMTVSTEYSGTGEDFAWIIPVPNPLKIADIDEPTPVGQNRVTPVE